MTATPQPISSRLLLAFEGTVPPPDLPSDQVSGFTLFRDHNVSDAGQLRNLTEALHGLAVDGLPMLMCIDQEGGQFLGLGDIGTAFPGNMALGATGDAALVREVAAATGRELRSLGINVNYAPVADLTTNPDNPSLGIRSFGDEPSQVATMVAATVTGLREAGVAATVKHFPGKGEARVDSHFGLPILKHARDRLDSVELVPFVAGLDAGAELVMTGHFALPELTGRTDLPATLASDILVDLLRQDLHFGGVVVSDAFNMAAITQGATQIIDAIAALNAGVDLLLLTFEPEMRTALPEALRLAAARGLIDLEDHAVAGQRIAALRTHLAGFETPGLEVLRCDEHLSLAQRAAAAAVTVVRNATGLLPLTPTTEQRLLAIMPKPENLTPADTSVSVAPHLATALRRHHPNVDEIVTTHSPSNDEIAAVATQAAGYSAVVVGTISASMNPAQASMVNGILEANSKVITVAMRTPWDVTAYPASQTHVCTYGILPPSLDALAAAIFGKAPTPGCLPTRIPGLHHRGHGLEL
ncbi:MAG: glycoside hydrolase family 3 protein [bacterium]|nr:glycoside hydrolase family 3 protein [bacterium]